MRIPMLKTTKSPSMSAVYRPLKMSAIVVYLYGRSVSEHCSAVLGKKRERTADLGDDLFLAAEVLAQSSWAVVDLVGQCAHRKPVGTVFVDDAESSVQNGLASADMAAGSR